MFFFLVTQSSRTRDEAQKRVGVGGLNAEEVLHYLMIQWVELFVVTNVIFRFDKIRAIEV